MHLFTHDFFFNDSFIFPCDSSTHDSFILMSFFFHTIHLQFFCTLIWNWYFPRHHLFSCVTFYTINLFYIFLHMINLFSCVPSYIWPFDFLYAFFSNDSFLMVFIFMLIFPHVHLKVGLFKSRMWLQSIFIIFPQITLEIHSSCFAFFAATLIRSFSF